MKSNQCICGCKYFVWFVREQGRYSSDTPWECYDWERHPCAVCSKCCRKLRDTHGATRDEMMKRKVVNCEICGRGVRTLIPTQTMHLLCAMNRVNELESENNELEEQLKFYRGVYEKQNCIEEDEDG